ncbi:MAG: sodium/solute symporter [Pirellulales bacterium]
MLETSEPMGSLRLSSVDVAMVLAYLLGILALGMWLSRGIKTGRDLFLAGKSLPWWAVGASLVVSDIGAKDMVGLADDGYRYGLVMTNFDFIGCIFPVLIAAFLFMPYLWLAGVYTIPEYLGRRYNQAVRTLFAIIWGVFMTGMLAVIYVSAANVFEHLLGWEFWFSVLVTAVIVGLYTTMGGLKAVVFTDLVSCIVLIVGASLVCIFGLVEVGGWSGLQARIAEIPGTENHFELLLPADSDTPYPWPAVLLGLGFVLGPAYWIGNQAIVQRTFGTRSQNEARASYVLCAAIKLVFPLLLVIPGLIGLAAFHDRIGPADGPGWEGGQVLPTVLQLLPPGVLGIVVGAFLAGVMSNLDSYVNSAATLCVTDLYQPLIRPQASDRESLFVGRGLIVLFLAGGAAMSYRVYESFDSVYEAFQTFMSIFQGALLALLLLGMLSSRTTQWGGLAGMVCGVGSAVVMHLWHRMDFLPASWQIDAGISFLWVAWWSFVAAVAGTVAVSLVTRPFDKERLRGLVYWLPAEEADA